MTIAEVKVPGRSGPPPEFGDDRPGPGPEVRAEGGPARRPTTAAFPRPRPTSSPPRTASSSWSGGRSAEDDQPVAKITRHGLNPAHPLKASVQEGDVPHRLGFSLGVHQHPVPSVKHDRLVVGVPNPSPDVDARISPHRLPAPRLGSRVGGENPLVLLRCTPLGWRGQT